MKVFPSIGPKSKKQVLKSSEVPYSIDSEVFPNFPQSVSFDRSYSKHLGPIEGNTLYT